MGNEAVFHTFGLDGVICVVDLDLNGRRSVTNDIENVLRKIAKDWPGLAEGRPVIYKDSMGVWDWVLHENGRFVDFRSLGGATTPEAAIAELSVRFGYVPTKSDACG